MQIGPFAVTPPVVLAPMAGITNVAFRKLCREHGAGLYVCEMVTTRGIVERNPKTLRMVAFDKEEHPRSLQVYGVDPKVVGRAVGMVADEGLADHIDINFGCPVPKVTRRGGGAALPWRHKLFGRIVKAAVTAAEPAGVPVTIKMRMGIDEEHLTYRQAGLIAQEAGVKAVALHARTAAQRYSGTAHWDAIADLVQVLDVPVLGNGDIWEADDALRMVEQTGCAGVVVGRGCLGRPWLFADLAAAFAGSPKRVMPNLGEVAQIMRRHAALLVEWSATEIDPRGKISTEQHGCADFRKHIAWYLKGFPVGGELRRLLAMVSSLAELDDLLGKLDPAAPFPVSELGHPRGRTNSPGKVALPEGWIEDVDSAEVPSGAEMEHSGG